MTAGSLAFESCNISEEVTALPNDTSTKWVFPTRTMWPFHSQDKPIITFFAPLDKLPLVLSAHEQALIAPWFRTIEGVESPCTPITTSTVMTLRRRMTYLSQSIHVRMPPCTDLLCRLGCA